MNKIIILVLSSKTYPSKRNAKYQKKTWVKEKNDNVKVFFYEAGKKDKQKESHLFFDVNKSELDIGYKNVKAFKWILQNENFDYVFRTNTSSYVSKKNLENFVKTLNKINKNKYLYSGIRIVLPKGSYKDEISLVSGSGILMNRETLSLIVEKSGELDHELWEDVSIGQLLNKYGIYPQPGHREDIQGNIFNQIISLDHYHYRCRIDNHYGYPRFLEKYVLKELDRRFNKLNLNIYYQLSLTTFFEVCRAFYIPQFSWKVYIFIKSVFVKILPEKLFKILKRLLNKKIQKFQLRYFKK